MQVTLKEAHVHEYPGLLHKAPWRAVMGGRIAPSGFQIRLVSELLKLCFSCAELVGDFVQSKHSGKLRQEKNKFTLSLCNLVT